MRARSRACACVCERERERTIYFSSSLYSRSKAANTNAIVVRQTYTSTLPFYRVLTVSTVGLDGGVNQIVCVMKLADPHLDGP